MTNIDVAHLGKEFYLKLVTDKQERSFLPLDPLGPDIDDFICMYQRFAEIDRIALKTNDFSRIRLKVDKHLIEKNIEVEKDSLKYAHICHEFLKSRKAAFEIMAARADGNYDNPHDRITSRLTDCAAGPSSFVMPGDVMTAILGKGGQLSEIIKAYIADMQLKKGWNKKTLACNESALKLFEEVMGDKDIRDYINEDFSGSSLSHVGNGITGLFPVLGGFTIS